MKRLPVMLLSIVAIVQITPVSKGDQAADTLQFAIPVSALIASLSIGDWEGSQQCLKSAAAAYAITHALKYTVGEKRPDGGSSMSFPSGHTSSAFQGAAYVQRRYGWKYAIPAYIGATYTGWSRVDENAHYPHDVFAGAAIGILSSYLFTTPYENDVAMGAFWDGDTAGIQVSVKW